MKKLLAIVPMLLLAAAISNAQCTTTTCTGTSTLSLTVGAEATLAITNGTTNFAEGSGAFADYGATTQFSYSIRTITSGQITLAFASDFSPTTGPSFINSATTGDKLTYTCTNSQSAVACSTSQNVTAITTAYPVAAFGTSYTTPRAGSTGSVIWNLVNDPNYLQGSYSTTATFTISAT